MDGPTFKIVGSCRGCKHDKYRNEESHWGGTNYLAHYCDHPNLPDKQYLEQYDTRQVTPDWCPFYGANLIEHLVQIGILPNDLS